LVVPLVTSQNISWQGHLGGLVTGGLVAAALVYAPRERRNLLQAGAVVTLLVVFVALIWWRTQSLFAQFGIS
jgi:membrane associated rhomboid family serine protease